ncbi:hypothetical protein D3C80_1817580 [compost metagenome]
MLIAIDGIRLTECIQILAIGPHGIEISARHRAQQGFLPRQRLIRRSQQFVCRRGHVRPPVDLAGRGLRLTSHTRGDVAIGEQLAGTHHGYIKQNEQNIRQY